MRDYVGLVLIGLIGCMMRYSSVEAKHPADFITPEIMEMIRPDKERCMAEHGTTEELIQEVNDGHLPDDRRITCYAFCLFEAFSLIDDEGTLEVEMLIGFIPDEYKAVAHDLIEHCAHETGTDVCNKMYKMAKCVQAKRPDLWFMI
ncbi:hypothetical protein QAD02_006061 [Eretmocerus hayati]|uniref:Uncharacterized protein n=1 Tax=Eretmocerus hayati TaxID=131215 RepID=A0ACC2N274_9HYME|nr:hypothetical protein QAD02_006061 [Eretmocerus hayati]